MNKTNINCLYQSSSFHHVYVPTLIRSPSLSYTLVLLALAPQVSSLTYSPVSMTDTNKAKEYGLGAAAVTCALVSLLASTLCMYWFCRMHKRFRHR